MNDSLRLVMRWFGVAMLAVTGAVFAQGNYPSKGDGERGAWFRDSEGNLLAIGQPVRR